MAATRLSRQRLRAWSDAAPTAVMALARRHKAMVVVREDNKTDVAGLQGKPLALSKLTREHCRLFLERRCVQGGQPLDKWFSKVSTPRTPEDALDDVAENTAQATSTHSSRTRPIGHGREVGQLRTCKTRRPRHGRPPNAWSACRELITLTAHRPDQAEAELGP